MRAHGKLSDGQTVWDLINPNEEFGPDHRDLSEYEQRECLDELRREIRHTVVNHHQKMREREVRRVSYQTT